MTTDPHQPPAGNPGGTGAPPQTDPAAGPTPPSAPGLAFFNQLRAFGIVRPDDGRVVAGVCAGIARRFGLDPLLVRGVFVVLAVIGGFGFGLYGLAWMFLPQPDGRIHAEGVLHGVVTSGFVGSLLFVVLDLGRSGSGAQWPFWGLGWGAPRALVALLAIGFVWWLIDGRGRRGGVGPQPPAGPWSPAGPGTSGFGPGAAGTGPSPAPGGGAPAPGDVPGTGGPAPAGFGGSPATGYDRPAGPTGYPAPAYGTPPVYGTPPPGAPAGPAVSPLMPPPRPDLHAPSHALTLSVLGLALVGAAVTVLVDRVHPLHAHAALVAPAVALGVVALGVVVAGVLGRRSGGLAPIAVLLALVSVLASLGHGLPTRSGHAVWRPLSATTAEAGFSLGVGDAVLDLTDPGVTAGHSAANPVEIPAEVGVGRIRVLVPSGTAVEVDASVGAGGITDRVNDATDTPPRTTSGAGVSRVVHTGGDNAVVIVHASVGLGDIAVEPQGQGVTP